MDAIGQNIQRILDEINNAAAISGRKPEDIRLVAVCKKQPVEKIEIAIKAGILDLAENYPEQAIEKIIATKEQPVHWHMIGHIQSRKAKLVADNFDMVHSVDSESALVRLNDRIADSGKILECLLEINIANESNKSGFLIKSIENPVELDEVFKRTSNLEHIRLRGLMIMPPYTDEKEESRKYFKQASELLHVLQIKHPQVSLDYLSMGTSQDFSVAIQEGATHIRIGTAIFGLR